MRRGRPRHPDVLTPRQWEVLRLVREGLSNEEIARRLGISTDGAKFHVSEILSKLGVTSRGEAARWDEDHERQTTRPSALRLGHPTHRPARRRHRELCRVVAAPRVRMFNGPFHPGGGAHLACAPGVRRAGRATMLDATLSSRRRGTPACAPGLGRSSRVS